MNITASLNLLLKVVESLTDAGFGAQSDLATFPFSQASLTTGTGADQGNTVYRAKRTLTASSSESIDLTGSLTDIFGNTVTNARIKWLAIYNANTVAGDTITIGGAASNAWEGWTPQAGSKITIGPKGLFLLLDPSATAMAVTAGTGDLLKVLNNSGSHSVTYYILAVGSDT